MLAWNESRTELGLDGRRQRGRQSQRRPEDARDLPRRVAALEAELHRVVRADAVRAALDELGVRVRVAQVWTQAGACVGQRRGCDCGECGRGCRRRVG